MMLFDSEDNQRIINNISGFGGDISDNSGVTIRVRIDNTKISDVAALDGIYWLEKYYQPVLLNDVAAGIINVSDVQNTHGLTGSGQIVAVADSGLDTRKHPADGCRATGLCRPRSGNQPAARGLDRRGRSLGAGGKSRCFEATTGGL